MEPTTNISLNYLADAIEVGGSLLIALACLQASLKSVRIYLRPGAFARPGPDLTRDDKENLLLEFGGWLAISLQFLVAADILRTAIAPSWEEIEQLAAIIVLRIILGYFMQKELERLDHRRERQADRHRETQAPVAPPETRLPAS